MASELDRMRKYEDLANKHMQSADRALMQPTLPNAPKLKFLDAIGLWHKAAQCFGIAAEYEEAATAYRYAAEYMGNLDQPDEAAVYWLKSAEMMRRVDPLGSVHAYETAVRIFLSLGRAFTAANICRGIGEMFEEEEDWEGVVAAYRRSAEYYAADLYHPQSCAALLKVAKTFAVLHRYDDAVSAYEQVVGVYRLDNLLRPSVPQLLLKAGLCLLADGGPLREGLYSHQLLALRMKRWSALDYAFEYSREKLFLDNMLDLIPKADLDGFADHLFNFNNVEPLDAWSLRMLATVRATLDQELARRRTERDAHDAELARQKEARAAAFKSEYRPSGD